MPVFRFTHSAGDYARVIGEIREEGTLYGRSVRERHEQLSDDKRELQLWVTLRRRIEVHSFSASNVALLREQAAAGWEHRKDLP